MNSRRKFNSVVKASARVDKFSKSDIIVSPSILSANFSKLGEQVLFYLCDYGPRNLTSISLFLEVESSYIHLNTPI